MSNLQIQQLNEQFDFSNAEWQAMIKDLNEPIEPFYRRRLGYLDKWWENE